MSDQRTKLVEKAATAVSRGKYQRALDVYKELEKLEPRDGAWPRRCGEMHRHLDRRKEAVAAFARSVEIYARAGFLVKAIAVCKLILRIEPGHSMAREKLSELGRERFAAPERREFAPVAARPVKQPTIPPGQSIADIRLVDSVPGAQTVDGDEGISLIPLEIGDVAQVIDNQLGAALRATALFEGLAAASLELLLDGIILREVALGETIFRQGDLGGELYVIDQGEVRVIAESVAGEAVELGRLGEGEFFGEVALVANTPRSASVIASQNCELLVLGREAIARLIEVEPRVLTLLLGFVRDRLFGRLTQTHELLGSFPPEERAELASRFELLEVENGAAIIREGSPSSGLFVLLAGRLAVTRGSRHLATLRPGDVSGEMSLLMQEPAIATVTAETRAIMVRLAGAEFRQLIMTHPQVLAYVGDLAETRRRLIESNDSGGDSGEYADLHVDFL